MEEQAGDSELAGRAREDQEGTSSQDLVDAQEQPKAMEIPNAGDEHDTVEVGEKEGQEPRVPKTETSDVKNADIEETSEGLKDLSISAPTQPLPQKEASVEDSHRLIPPLPSSESEKPYLDPTPKTPQPSRPVSRTSSDHEDYNEKGLALTPEPTYESEVEHKSNVEEEGTVAKDSQSEIQSIMEQFEVEAEAPGQDEIMSPRLGLAGPHLGVGQFPPRRSSLEPLRPLDTSVSSQEGRDSSNPPPVPPKSPPSQQSSLAFQKSPVAPNSPSNLSGMPPEPEPELPFDFHRFLEQLRHKSADPVAKFLRSFLTEFGKKQWMVHEQVKIISDFLAFITTKMAQCEVWRDVSDTEFDNAKEGMEKLVMNRLYTQTFSPAIPPAPPLPRSRSKRKEQERLNAPGRRGQHQEDVERDDVLAQKIRIYGWISEEHLDIPAVGPGGKRFLTLDQQELFKIKGYRAPRDKVICVLNCCKVIFGLLKNAKTQDTSADSFVPLLIYVVLHANPEHLVSNIQYILRFRNQDKLGGESGYYLSSLSGAIQFIETLDRTSLTISDEDFERNVEIAVQAIAEKNREADAHAQSPTAAYGLSEKSNMTGPAGTPRASMDAAQGPSGSPQRRLVGHQSSLSNDGSVGGEDNPAVAGILRTIQRPLSTIGRIFSDETPTTERPPPVPPRGLSPAVFKPPRDSVEGDDQGEATGPHSPSTPNRYTAEEAAARQASAEAAEAQRIQRKEHQNVVE